MNPMNKMLTTAAFVVLLGGATMLPVAHAANDQPNGMDRQFAMMVGQGNIAEIQSSRLALQKSSNKGVRKVATMLIDQHKTAQESLKQAARKVNVAVPSDTDPLHKAEYRKLSRLSGAAFDREYLKAQVHDHYATIGLFNKELKNGENSTLQGFATRYLPDIETHTQHIVAQADKFGIPTASKMASK